MDLVHVHLLLNHFPVIGLVLGLLLFIFAFVQRSNELKKVSLGIFVLLAILSIPVYFSGEPAEKSVENFPGVSESIIEQHEDAALVALSGLIILGIVSLIAILLTLEDKFVIPRSVLEQQLPLGINQQQLRMIKQSSKMK